MTIQIAIANRQTKVRLDRPLLRRAVRAVLNGEGIGEGEISLVFVDDAESARVNWEFLRHRGPTDVITFPLESAPLSGELVVCADVAARVARERGHDVSTELALYVIHGCLHLCGYDDKRPGPRKTMRERETHYLLKLRLPVIN